MSEIIHRDELVSMRKAVGELAPSLPHDDGNLVLALLMTTIRLFDHIDAMREHACFYKWSEVKANKRDGGPPPRCTRCGYESPIRYVREQSAALRDFMEKAVEDRGAWLADPTVADGTRGMERGR